MITMDGTRVYFAGDTDFIPEMNDIAVDIALLPVSGTYVMTAEEAAEAALAIHPKIAVPMHYGGHRGKRRRRHQIQESGEALPGRNHLRNRVI